MKFKLFMESDWKTKASFLDSYFEDPFDDSRLLVFADWLEDNGEPDLSRLVRLSVQGHDKKSGRSFTNEVNLLLAKVKPANVNFLNDYEFSLKRTIYEVGFDHIRDRNEYQIPSHLWTKDIVDAAVYLLVKRLTQTPHKRFKDGDETWFDRPTGLKQRQLLQFLIQFSVVLKGTNIHNMTILDIYRWLGPSIDHLMQIIPGDTTKLEPFEIELFQVPAIKEMARRCRDLMEEIEEHVIQIHNTTLSNYAFAFRRLQKVIDT